ncbi:MAG: hypothetical protein Ct9H90mP4_02580 [Gammaproteobacteria bacterium]|nr:MAG: hypothetical protein Ct9H90mP4_02580 [Gammaproteobacteria bacterium]
MFYHLGHESVEMFELTNRKNWELDWKGCTKPSNDKYLNDVSLRKDGSFFVSHMYDRDTGYLDFLLASFLKYKNRICFFCGKKIRDLQK